MAFATGGECGSVTFEKTTIGHISEVEGRPLGVGDVMYKIHVEVLWDAMRAGLKGVIDLSST